MHQGPSRHGRAEPLLGRADAERIARSLRALADPTRVQLLALIVESPDARRSVTDLADELGLTQPTVSHHLRVMAAEGLVERRQQGRLAWYSIAPTRMADVVDAMRDDPVAAVVAPPVLDRIASDLAERFSGTLSPETVDRYVRESYQLLAERAGITRYLPSLTARFAADRLRALTSVDSPEDAPIVLFVCVQNAGRSQLAAAILRSLAGDQVRVLTAGSEPAGAVHPLVIAALDEIGVPVVGEFPKPLTDEVVRAADVVVTMGCGDACPVYPGRRYLDWELADPAALSMDGVREVRDQIEVRVRDLLTQLMVNSA
ncbi:MAG: metalloregulator ArsR/SmtB family transcription factor [Rhodoglobus sp.]